jgi:hypothetical protein
MGLFIPSFNALIVTGFLMLLVLILIANNYKLVLNLDFYRKLNLLLFLAIALGVHGLLHLGLEVNYGFNPYNWFL